MDFYALFYWKTRLLLFERQFQSTGDPWRMQPLGLVKKLDIAKFCSRGFNTFNRQKKKNANL